jgi:hypothetical protein
MQEQSSKVSERVGNNPEGLTNREEKQVATVRNGLPHRFFWAGLALLLCLSALRDVSANPSLANAVSATAWALLSIAWFMQPLVLTSSVSSSLRRSAAISIGSTRLRSWLGGLGLFFLVLSLVLRFVNVA